MNNLKPVKNSKHLKGHWIKPFVVHTTNHEKEIEPKLISFDIQGHICRINENPLRSDASYLIAAGNLILNFF